MRLSLIGIMILLMFSAVFAFSADEQSAFNSDLNFAQVDFVTATETSKGVWRFDVAVRHRDEGWDHYADLWQVVTPEDLDVLGERVLAHPHENEQPFTRSLGGVSIAADLNKVLIRAKCNVHGFGGRGILVDLSEAKGPGYQVQHRAR